MRTGSLTFLLATCLATINAFGQASPQTERMVYPTHHLSASEAADKISALYANDKESKLTIVAEPTTNCLLVAAPPDTLREVVQILDKLDQRQPMVGVDVWIVSLQTAAEKGNGNSQATVAVVPGPKAKVAEQLAKLERDGQATVLNHIQLSTLAGSSADAQQGEHKPRITASNVTASGRVSTAMMTNLGTSIKVLPRVVDNDRITLSLGVEKSFDGPSASGVVVFKPATGDEVRATSTFNLTANNTVTVRSGEAAALAGVESGSSEAAGAVQILVAAEILPDQTASKK
jgi:type II secretory pathway component GspD/PulD (secretin)